ncbi:malonic semialdehyde reductase [Rickettsiales bacterium]|nr:malonic semialdehyde reductase [Rickettsiales bacterium]
MQEFQNQVFNEGKTYYSWQQKTVDISLVKQAFDFAMLGPTSFNCEPIRLIFIESELAKKRLKPHLMEANIDKTMQAPLTAIIAYDLKFHEKLPKLFPNYDAKSVFDNMPEIIADSAFRNSSLQAGYFILALRSVGLDSGAMSGFNNKSLDEDFFPDGNIKSNFLLNIGYGEENPEYQRAPRLKFDEICNVI